MSDPIRDKLAAFLASPLAQFTPWKTPDGRSPQLDFIRGVSTHKVRILRAGNRTGKSYCASWDHVAIAAGMHPYYPKPGPTKGWIIGTDWGQGIGTVIWPRIKKFLPMSEVADISYLRRSSPEIPSAVLFKNGSSIMFKSADAGPSKFAGADLDWVWIDEEIDASVVEEARMRLVDRGGLLSVTLTPVTSMQWIMDLEGEKDAKGNPSTLVVRASMRDAMEAKVIDREAVQRILGNLPDWKRRLRELGDFASAEGLVYPEFSRATHVLKIREGGLYDSSGKWCYPWPLPRDWYRYAAMDFGYGVPSAVVILAEDPYSQRKIVERVLYANEIRASRWGNELSRGLLPRLEAPLVTDWDAMERAELAACGIPTCAAKKDIIPGIEAVERALHPIEPDGRPQLLFVMGEETSHPQNHLTGRDDCHHLIWEMERYHYEKRKEGRPDGKDLPVKRDDHAMDALRYLIYFLERRDAGAPIKLPRDFTDKINPLDGLAPPNPWERRP